MATTVGEGQQGKRLDYHDVVRITGSLPAWKMSAILALNPTPREVEQAVAWVSVESGDSGLHHEGTGDAAAEARISGIYEILVSDRAEPEA